MNRIYQTLSLTLLTLAAIILPEAAYADGNDSLAMKKNLVGRVIDYFDKSNKRAITRRPNFTPLGGPHYSSEKGIGLGIVIAGNYSTCPEDSLLPISNISLVGDVGSKGYYSIGICGNHVFPNNSRRLNYTLRFQSFSTYFWGIGYNNAYNDANKTKYQLLDVNLKVDYEWKVAPAVFIGPAIEAGYTLASDAANYILWEGQQHRIFNLSVGGYLLYDRRDNLTYPHRGALVDFSQIFSPSILGNGRHHYTKTELSFNRYLPIWHNGVLATRFHSVFTIGKTPWNKLPLLGGNSMRAYYEGRYRDKCETDLTVELRQHLYRRSGLAVWCGIGTVYHNFSGLQFKKILPETGIGYRWEFKKNSNVRVDFGIGRRSTGFLLGLNEAF